MKLPNDLINKFVKSTNDNKKETKESTVYGTVVKDNDSFYVKLDGSDQLTPINTTSELKDGDRVIVMIKNHTATITGNLTSPSARSTDISETIIRVDKLETDKVSSDDVKDMVKGNILWTGSDQMDSTTAINLDAPISEQTVGIVLIFSSYSENSAQNGNFSHHFIHKKFVELMSGCTSSFTIRTSNKILTINDSSIVGDASNVTDENSGYVLRYVIGI